MLNKEIIEASLVFGLSKHNHFSFKLSSFVAILQVLQFEFQSSGFWKFLTFTHGVFIFNPYAAGFEQA